METVEERDPLTNLKLLEENRPSFHWQGTQSLKTLVYGADAHQVTRTIDRGPLNNS